MEDETRTIIRKRGIRRSSPSSPIREVLPLCGEEPATTTGNNPVEPAAATSKNAFIQMIGVTSVWLISCPTVSVPKIKANDAEPLIQPYSNSRPANRGLAALTDNASAREVVGATQAAWITVVKSSKEKECAQNNATADAAADEYRVREQDATNLLDLPTSQPMVPRQDASTSRQRA